MTMMHFSAGPFMCYGPGCESVSASLAAATARAREMQATRARLAAQAPMPPKTFHPAPPLKIDATAIYRRMNTPVSSIALKADHATPPIKCQMPDPTAIYRRMNQGTAT
jgi:hypothetical protein